MKLLVDDLQHAIPYPAALQRWAASLGVDGARELSGLFRQSLFQGTELGPALKEFAADFSDKRVARARESIGDRKSVVSGTSVSVRVDLGCPRTFKKTN